MARLATCPKGHQWEVPPQADDGTAAEASVCPECGSAAAGENVWRSLPPRPEGLSKTVPFTSEPAAEAWPSSGDWSAAPPQPAGRGSEPVRATDASPAENLP